ncbi:hypothetical protein A3F58_03675 [Candidatus Roizmanbacteria bacterium RIFCSPHIGHO2_12_FULL_37_9b]|uniref:Nudix hydrolase domain-containing protein n=1 Tax=Candidatus Roizmanbacteria bacterium RIFCSPHIGHO2_02_FULL_38_11 TaxID=1802039 RepID=A0A1F7H075_9BACT|nr:MAG: hypothetical protein A3C25_03015 [Candidatus Roizmanbacteria bacterium RIFCSPHIGHO2_02_FULL_38_11]OGK34165.1 MAG: hypothetical protein A3F58_03675 [Candidatus Roizmanbacteria bacterium RIFCSPHIGHO2_12_FULL_37_9b]
MRKTFLSEISKLKDKIYVDKKTIEQFLKRLKSGRLLQKQNPADHFCSFFVPLDIKSKSVFLGHHIKANQWIPPGGHIEVEETPLQTVYREFTEELRLPLSDQKVELFDLGITRITDPKRLCRIHYDFWYLTTINKINFKYDKSEFYEAAWLTIDDAIAKVKRSSIKMSLNNLKQNHVHL